MDQLDEAVLRVDAAIKRLEQTAQSRAAGPPASGPGAAEWDAVMRRIDTALAKARAARVALD